ncbi:MAG TPA: saccharopine dehydrogenase C-terminal domain-containing protein [Chitinophagaceae bacterium]|nr:saccharopine dehydrogenase NADP-binding domain-containing protein [Chitinophagaceae bacterium]MCC6633882.1 saccharopine dehydrogenase NADP-binding domain-containing protein [Chitinophagaceae bacterium]HNE93091.1 saccharopine dehydrogenase C-terminal domain-containing protein [Chitinophagaceae bacterium]HNF29657.1 saccharopine dehydrogenase C-terminal domain-containing protein [Chitinophagaceae bacterium]HNM35305.1 saccharopine dehydrogenase C-terminal domain-containing protein [Chitinophagac
MTKILVVGAGMVGSAMALDLSKKYAVTVADINSTNLNKIQQKNNAIQIISLDVTDETALTNCIVNFNFVVCAVPGFLGFKTLRTIINTGKSVVDISFFPENALELDALAKQKNVTAIVDCGVAPGMGNIIVGYQNTQMQINNFECLVGGLPKIKKWPFNYKAPFSPIDVIEEYTRPARYIENGNLVVKPAMSDIEHIEMDGVGTLEAFNSDGLRSLIYTMPHITNMKEKTLRYPGHIEKIIALRDAGFFNEEPIIINNTKISPLEFTSKILFKEWLLGEEEEEITVMKIIISGTQNDQPIKVEYNLYDEYNATTKTSSMARTTGYTATAAVCLIVENLFVEKGIFPPELVGKNAVCYNYIINYLLERGVKYKQEVTIG